MSTDREEDYTVIESDFATEGNRSASSGDVIKFLNEGKDRLLEAEYTEARYPSESERFDYTDLAGGPVTRDEEVRMTGLRTTFVERAHVFRVNDPRSEESPINLEVHEADVHFGGERLAESIDQRYEELV